MNCRHLPYEHGIVVVVGEHVDPCAREWMPELEGHCGGCSPCPIPADRHCTVTTCCTHLDPGELQTCTSCRGLARRCLLDVVELTALLPDQALNAARDGHLAAADALPGGDALVLMSRGSEGLDDTGDTNAEDLLPPAYVLAWWEEQLASHWHQPSATPPWQDRPARTMVRSAAYLSRNLERAASHYPGFHALVRDMRRTRAQLEDQLHAGDEPAAGVPCFVCGASLTRTYRDPTPCRCGPRPRASHIAHHRTDACCLGCATELRWELEHERHDQGGQATTDPLDGWVCPRCQRAYTPGEYGLAVAVLHEQHATALPAAELGDRLGVSRQTVWRWGNAGHVRTRGRAPDGRQLYDVADATRHARSNRPADTTTKAVQP